MDLYEYWNSFSDECDAFHVYAKKNTGSRFLTNATHFMCMHRNILLTSEQCLNKISVDLFYPPVAVIWESLLQAT